MSRHLTPAPKQPDRWRSFQLLVSLLLDYEGRLTENARAYLRTKAADLGLPSLEVERAIGLAQPVREEDIIPESPTLPKPASGYPILPVAGTGEPGFNGDGIPATQARLDRPYGLTIAPNGHLYIADAGNHRIRKVDSNGIITTIVGGSIPGMNGDRDLATKAHLNNPHGVFACPNGLIYIADSNNLRIRYVNAKGALLTLAYHCSSWASLQMLDTFYIENFILDIQVDADGTVIVVDEDQRVWELQYGGKRANCIFNCPGYYSPYRPSITGISVDSRRRRWIARKRDRIVSLYDRQWRHLYSIGREITFDSPASKIAVDLDLHAPVSVAVDRDDNLYIADEGASLIYRVTPDNEVAIVAAVNCYGGMVVHPNGNLYVADSRGHRIWKVVGVTQARQP